MLVATIIGFCILLLLYPSSAIRCYQCNFCEDDFQVAQANIINCTGSCEKGKHNSDVVRLCSPAYVEDVCHRRQIGRGMATHHACACNQDLCNQAMRCGEIVFPDVHRGCMPLSLHKERADAEQCLCLQYGPV